MHTQETKRLAPLKSGQLWKLEHGYLQIVELGHSLIHYKILRHPDQKAALTRMLGLEAFFNYLRHSEAELLSDVACAVA